MFIRRGAIVSLPCLTQKKEILNKLPADVSNPVCDMETYAIASLCAEKGIRFFAIRGITDLAYQDITSDIAGIVDESGRTDIIQAIKTVLKKPQIIPSLICLGIYSSRASGNLRTATIALLDALH
jgi:adenosylhomocysteine nucleosidase